MLGDVPWEMSVLQVVARFDQLVTPSSSEASQHVRKKIMWFTEVGGSLGIEILVGLDWAPTAPIVSYVRR